VQHGEVRTAQQLLVQHGEVRTAQQLLLQHGEVKTALQLLLQNGEFRTAQQLFCSMVRFRLHSNCYCSMFRPSRTIIKFSIKHQVEVPKVYIYDYVQMVHTVLQDFKKRTWNLLLEIHCLLYSC